MGYTEKVGRQFPGGDTGDLAHDLYWELKGIASMGESEQERYNTDLAAKQARERGEME